VSDPHGYFFLSGAGLLKVRKYYLYNLQKTMQITALQGLELITISEYKQQHHPKNAYSSRVGVGREAIKEPTMSGIITLSKSKLIQDKL